MPARDPATSPHMPTTLGQSSSPVLPVHLGHGHAHSPSSSAWSRLSSAQAQPQPHYGSLEWHSPSHSPTLVQQLLRRVSADKGTGHALPGRQIPPPPPPAAGAGPSGRNHGVGPGFGGAAGMSGYSQHGNESGGSDVQVAVGSLGTFNHMGSGYIQPGSGQTVDDRPMSPIHASTLSTSHHAIRDSTNRLASLSFTKPRRPSLAGTPDRPSSARHDADSPTSPRTERTHHRAAHSDPSFTPTLAHPHPHPASSVGPPFVTQARTGTSVPHKPIQPSHLHTGFSVPISEEISPPKPPSGPTSASGSMVGRSALSVMMDREQERRRKATLTQALSQSQGNEGAAEEDVDKTPIPPLRPLHSSGSSELDLAGDITPKGRKEYLTLPVSRSITDLAAAEPDGSSDSGSTDRNSSSALRRYLAAQVEEEDGVTERTGLLSQKKQPGVFSRFGEQVRNARQRAGKVTAKDVGQAVVLEPLKTLPSVILGCLLNVLDGVSYGMILFPANSYFVDFGSLGVSMFFVSCIVSQLVFSLGGSIFPGGNGSMMIEAVPFYHILINIIEGEVGDDDGAIIATTMVSFAFSSLLTGLIFFALGAFKLGGLIGYFPRHILVGCIGGVGIFLIETGLEVSRGLKEEGFDYSLKTLRLFFDSPHNIILWTLPLILAITLRVITHHFHHQLIFPAYFFAIPLIFYIVVAIGGWSFDDLREAGWVFDVGAKTQAWWKFYTLFDFKKTDWSAFWAAMPTQLALVFFGILHVPLNVPALGVTLAEDNVNLDRELIAHGFSNFAAGMAGTVPNYLTYVNTVLFYRVGGGSRLSGIMLAFATAIIMFVGPSVIGYLPITLVGALIYVLGIDLLIEAVWDTRNRVNRMEYITIWAIAIGMTVWDFVIGLLFGIILACIFFVVQNSRRRPIRVIFDGASAKSTVRRPRSQRAFIQQVGSQTCVMKLQGFLFFGTITNVEAEIRKLLEVAIWQHNPIRFLIIDFKLVYGLDFSSAEAFVRIQRLLSQKDVLLILCGAKPEGLVGTALQMVDVWADREGTRVEVFEALNDALEWTENAFLTAFYENQRDTEVKPMTTVDFPKVAKPPFSLAESFQNSPRRSHLARAGGDTLPHTYYVPEDTASSDSTSYTEDQPLPLLLQTFASYPGAPSPSWFARLVPYFHRATITANQVLWRQGDAPDGLYLIEVGSLRATYAYGGDHPGSSPIPAGLEGAGMVQETMVAGTVAGDLSMLSDTKRNATVVAERDGILWRLDKEGLERMERDNAELTAQFTRIVLKAVTEEQDVLFSHLIAVLS